MTHQRLEICREIAISCDHPDAESIHKGVRQRVPSVSLDTVYRTLWQLLDLGLVSSVGSLHDRARFDANLVSHHHFVCTKCGATHDFYSDELDPLRIPDRVKALGDVTRAQVEVRGLCRRCSSGVGDSRKTHKPEEDHHAKQAE
ncbi:MAG TPA: transcriptional repressor [Candidatus Hydrogenedentes bacterium]|nr:transcriptional repressor [Candidatus Hydrogenedentota bacterium]HPG66938.1 transcriptional repressor [Candidatus Hydrogenedentota bacterium]